MRKIWTNENVQKIHKKKLSVQIVQKIKNCSNVRKTQKHEKKKKKEN